MIYIEARSTDTTKEIPIIQAQVGTLIKETDTKTCTESEALTAVQAKIPLDSKSQPIAVKYYKHICYHGTGCNKPCEMIEIEPPKVITEISR